MVPDYIFIDALLIAYRTGHIRNPEQKESMLAAARAATDAMSFLTALSNFGVGEQSRLYQFVAKYLAAPIYYRRKYPMVIGLRNEVEEAESFLMSQKALFLTEPVLTSKQQKVFYDAYWWFVNNHKPIYIDSKKSMRNGIYATEPKDNDSTMERFEDYLCRMANHRTIAIRQRYEGFPVDIVIAILKRCFT